MFYVHQSANLKVTDMRSVAASEITFFGSPNSAKTILSTLIRLSSTRLSALLMIGNML